MNWVVEIGDEFEPEFDTLHEDVRTEILAMTRLLQRFGPQLKRPRADSAADGELRVEGAVRSQQREPRAL